MISPLRITGSGYVGDSVTPAGLIVELETADGHKQMLTSSDGDRGREIFLSPDGFSGVRGAVSWDETEAVGQYGVRRTGRHSYRVSPLSVNLAYGLRAERGGLPDLVRRWEGMWSAYEVQKLHVRSSYGRFWANVVDPTFPEWPDNLLSRRVWETSMQCRVLDGHWFGETEVYTGNFTMTPRGDKPLSPSMKLVWPGNQTTVKFPSGLTVTLPGVNVERHINLDRGFSGQVTKPDGTVDTGLWSSFQGLISGLSLTPGKPTTWVLGTGVELHVTPRYLSPLGRK